MTNNVTKPNNSHACRKVDLYPFYTVLTYMGSLCDLMRATCVQNFYIDKF